jgi:hypothetical protein
MCRLQPANPLGWLAARLLEPAPRGSNGIDFTASEAGTSALALIPVQLLPVADESKDAVRIQEREAQVRDLKARLTADASSVGSFSGPQAPFQISMQSPSALMRERVTQSPASDGAQSYNTLARDPALFRKLADAATSSLKRKDKRFMSEVFNRHAKPLRLSAKALATALHAIDPSSFAAHVSDADSAKNLKEVETRNKGHADFEEFCQAARRKAECADTSAASDVFLRFADVKGLTAEALVDALKEVSAPVLLSTEGCSPEQIFRRVDANTSGSVDLAESDPPLVHFSLSCSSLLFQVHACS